MQRQLALEVIITLSETAAAMLRKHTAIVAQCGENSVKTKKQNKTQFKRPSRVCLSFPVPQMLAMMVDLEDDDEWAMADELEDDDFDRYCPPLPLSPHDSLALRSFLYLFIFFVWFM